MSAWALSNIEEARQKLDRAMSMLSLIEACLYQEEQFQDAHVSRPHVEGGGYIPGLGEIINAVSMCRDTLDHCYDLLTSGGGRRE